MENLRHEEAKRVAPSSLWITLLVMAAIGGPGTARLFAQDGVWTTKASMPTIRFALATSVVNGIMYAIGGCNFIGSGGACVDLTTVEAYDPVTDTWTTKASMPSPRRQLGSAVVNGVIYAIGGITGPPLSTVEAYNPVSNTWSTKSLSGNK